MTSSRSVKSLVVSVSVIVLSVASGRLLAQPSAAALSDGARQDAGAARQRFEATYSRLGGPWIKLVDEKLARDMGNGFTNAASAMDAREWQRARDIYDLSLRTLRANEKRITREYPEKWLGLSESLMEREIGPEGVRKYLHSADAKRDFRAKLIIAASCSTNETGQKILKQVAPFVVQKMVWSYSNGEGYRDEDFGMLREFNSAIAPGIARAMLPYLDSPDFYEPTNRFGTLDLLADAFGVTGQVPKANDYMQQSWAFGPKYQSYKGGQLLRHAAFLAKSGAASDEVERSIKAAEEEYIKEKKAHSNLSPANLQAQLAEYSNPKEFYAKGSKYFWRLGLFEWAVTLIKRDPANMATQAEKEVVGYNIQEIFPLLAERGMVEEMKVLLPLYAGSATDRIFRYVAIGYYKAGRPNAAHDYLSRTSAIEQMEYWSTVAETEAFRGRVQESESALRQCLTLARGLPEKSRAKWVMALAYAKLALPETSPFKGDRDDSEHVEFVWTAGLACGRLGRLEAVEGWLLKLPKDSDRMLFYAGIAKGLSERN